MTMSAAICEALEARGLDVELASRMGFDSTRRDGTDWLIVPCYRDGRIYRRKLRTITGEKRFSQDGGGPIPWNEDVLRDESLAAMPLIITEGELDAMAAIQCGFPRTISVPDGAPAETTDSPFDAKRYAWVKDLAPRITRQMAPEIILAVDGDGPGQALLQDLSVMLGRFRCKFLTYPKTRDGSARLKDLNEVLIEYGTKGVGETINRAAFVQSEGVYRMAELPELPPSVSYAAGYELLDQNYRVRMGDLAVVTGIPSHGKSAFVNDFLCRLATTHGFRIAWASFEQEAQRDHRRALRTWRCGVPESKAHEHEIVEADAWIERHHRFIIAPEEADVSLDWMMERLEQAVVQHDCQIAVIDPWNEMDHMRERDETETEYVGRAIKRFKRFCRAFQVHLIIVAHPTKIRKDENGKTPMPTLYDIAGSANWNNKADVGIVVHREDEDNTAIKVAKSRYHSQIGFPGTVRMQFGKDNLRYRETERLA
jgi:twinkle protein